MSHEPSGLVGDAKHAVELVSAHALLAGAHEMHGQEPLVERNLRALEHGADSHRELLAAFGALVEAGAVSLALERSNAGRVGIAAVRADNAVGSTLRFKMLAGLVGIVENRVVECGGHGLLL